MKILFLGIDALDSLVLNKLRNQLPNLSSLQSQANFLKVRSTFPPDSDTAWATIVTGLNPAQHGIVRFIDPLEKVHQLQNVVSDNKILQFNTFWDIIGKAGFISHAIFPHLCYPVWDTPGVMVSRGSTMINGRRKLGMQAHPHEFLADYPNKNTLEGMVGFPDSGEKGLAIYAQKLIDITNADSDYALDLLRKLEWDVFFYYCPTIDGAGHFFWNYFDQNDPGFTEGHPLQQVIPDIYKLFDKIIGKFLNAVNNDVTVIILSDHGHGKRPYNLVNVNEVLRQAGFLKAVDFRRNPHLNMYEKIKRTGVKVVSRYGLAKFAGKVLHSVPFVKETLTRPSSIDWDRTIAYASDMSGIKAYTYGGITINKQSLTNSDYEKVRTEIIDLLTTECVLPDKTPLIQYIARREDLYAGPYITNYPDIVMEFKYGYGLGWAINVPLFTFADTYNLVPGSHRGDTGVCFIRSNSSVLEGTIDLLDITPTILTLMGIDYQNTYDGVSIFA